MPSITRATVAARVKERLDKLAEDLSTAAATGKTEGDFTYPIDDALQDCGYSSITEADSHAKIRAVLRGAEYYALERVWNRRAVLVTSTMGAGYASGQQHLEWNTLQEILRKRLSDAQAAYVGALAAIGKSLDADTTAGSAAGVLEIDDDDDLSKELVDGDAGLPWWSEGYHEVGD